MAQMKVLVPLLEGFEEIEAVTIIDVLRRADVSVTVAGNAAGPVRGAHGVWVVADEALDDVRADDFEMMVLPGGMPGAVNLAEHPRVQALLGEVAGAGHYTAAICAAPIALAAASLHQGKRYTCYPGFQQRIQGGTFSEDRVVIDGKLVTSRGPGTALEFALELVRLLRDDATAERLRAGMLVA